MTDTPQLRDRIADAVRSAPTGRFNVATITDAVLAVVQPDLDRARAEQRSGCPDPIECDHEAEAGQLRAELARVNDALRAAGIEHPHGAAGVRDLAAMANGRAEELATARAAALREAAAMLRKYCPTHGAEDTCLMDCHCAGADEINRDAKKIAPPAPTT